MLPADIVAYCKETFGQDVKLCTTKPIIGLTVTGPPNKTYGGLIPGIHIAQDARHAMYPKYRCQSPYYHFNNNGIFDLTYDPKQWYKQLEKTSTCLDPRTPTSWQDRSLQRRETLPGWLLSKIKLPSDSR